MLRFQCLHFALLGEMRVSGSFENRNLSIEVAKFPGNQITGMAIMSDF
jgi:hypothetical protein